MAISCEPTKLGALDAVHVSAGEASIKVALFGGTLYSFVAGDGEEKLFVSKEAVTDGSKPIRGGVPLVFPQFGSGPLPSHGFARTSVWEMVGQPAEVKDGFVETVFKLTHSEATLKVWPYEFELLHTIRFKGNVLETALSVHSLAKQPFPFQMLLHTYYRVGAIDQVSVSGFDALERIDQLKDREREKEGRSSIKIEAETDAIYTEAKAPLTILEGGKSARLGARFERDGEPRACDAVLWNPWTAKAQRMADFGDDEFNSMLCIEPGCVSRFETCQPGERWTLTQRITFAW